MRGLQPHKLSRQRPHGRHHHTPSGRHPHAHKCRPADAAGAPLRPWSLPHSTSYQPVARAADAAAAAVGGDDGSDGARSDAPAAAAPSAELAALLAMLPPAVAARLTGQHADQLPQLLEVVLDLGRPPHARFPGGDVPLGSEALSAEDLQAAVDKLPSGFDGDNRAGIDATLHRISALRNRAGRVVGLTCRVGRSVSGAAALVADLAAAGHSILLLGRPGIGKTTAVRELCRVLADEARRRVVIVDTSNEIGGDGDVPHSAIGAARRLQVPDPQQQHRVMIEAVENHTPQVVVIDEIGTEAECAAARTIAQRGVQLIASAHGNELTNLLQNPAMADLVGGVASVTLGDEAARVRGSAKTIRERAAPPTFTAVAEMQERDRWLVHADVAASVDALLSGREAPTQLRRQRAGTNAVLLRQGTRRSVGPGGALTVDEVWVEASGGGSVHLTQPPRPPPPPSPSPPPPRNGGAAGGGGRPLGGWRTPGGGAADGRGSGAGAAVAAAAPGAAYSVAARAASGAAAAALAPPSLASGDSSVGSSDGVGVGGVLRRPAAPGAAAERQPSTDADEEWDGSIPWQRGTSSSSAAASAANNEPSPPPPLPPLPHPVGLRWEGRQEGRQPPGSWVRSSREAGLPDRGDDDHDHDDHDDGDESGRGGVEEGGPPSGGGGGRPGDAALPRELAQLATRNPLRLHLLLSSKPADKVWSTLSAIDPSRRLQRAALPSDAHAIVASRGRARATPRVRQLAARQRVPLLLIKSSSPAALHRELCPLLGLDPLSLGSSGGGQTSGSGAASQTSGSGAASQTSSSGGAGYRGGSGWDLEDDSPLGSLLGEEDGAEGGEEGEASARTRPDRRGGFPAAPASGEEEGCSFPADEVADALEALVRYQGRGQALDRWMAEQLLTSFARELPEGASGGGLARAAWALGRVRQRDKFVAANRRALVQVEVACQARWDAMSGPQLLQLAEGMARLAQPLQRSAGAVNSAAEDEAYAPQPSWTANLKRALLQRWGELSQEGQRQAEGALLELEAVGGSGARSS